MPMFEWFLIPQPIPARNACIGNMDEWLHGPSAMHRGHNSGPTKVLI